MIDGSHSGSEHRDRSVVPLESFQEMDQSFSRPAVRYLSRSLDDNVQAGASVVTQGRPQVTQVGFRQVWPSCDDAAVLITGYEHYPLVDGSAFLTEPAFWAVHTMMVGAGGLNDLERSFGLDVDDAEALCEQLFGHDRWPVFAVPLQSGAIIHVIYRNLDGDMGMDYMLGHPDWRGDLQLAAVEGCFAGPGLSWPELTAIAHRPAGPSAPSALTPTDRLLLLLPALGDADLPDSAVSTLAAALTQATSTQDARRVAEILLYENRAYWAPAHWRQLVNGAIVCDGIHSRRSMNSPHAFTIDQAITITRALAGT
ncbi:hypothetical protein AB0C21_36920 [Spirillospora sp. NPDC049024]